MISANGYGSAGGMDQIGQAKSVGAGLAARSPLPAAAALIRGLHICRWRTGLWLGRHHRGTTCDWQRPQTVTREDATLARYGARAPVASACSPASGAVVPDGVTAVPTAWSIGRWACCWRLAALSPGDSRAPFALDAAPACGAPPTRPTTAHRRRSRRFTIVTQS